MALDERSYKRKIIAIKNIAITNKNNLQGQLYG